MPRCVECLRLLCFRRPANLPVIKTDAGMSLFRAIARRDGRILHRRLILNQPVIKTDAGMPLCAIARRDDRVLHRRPILNHSRSLWKRGAGRVWRCNG